MPEWLQLCDLSCCMLLCSAPCPWPVRRRERVLRVRLKNESARSPCKLGPTAFVSSHLKIVFKVLTAPHLIRCVSKKKSPPSKSLPPSLSHSTAVTCRFRRCSSPLSRCSGSPAPTNQPTVTVVSAQRPPKSSKSSSAASRASCRALSHAGQDQGGAETKQLAVQPGLELQPFHAMKQRFSC